MSYQKDSYSKQQVHRSVNPQGLSEYTKDQRPKSKLEERAKKKNTKI
ncbi:MAG: Small, acid-soluble spore protein L [Virgibacillus proomii]|jgi:small acid-soluble spore protein L (minor)